MGKESLLQNLNENPIYNQPAVTKNLINSSKHYLQFHPLQKKPFVLH